MDALALASLILLALLLALAIYFITVTIDCRACGMEQKPPYLRSGEP